MHHIAFELNDLAHIGRACDALAAAGIPLLWGPGRHGPGHNIFTYHRAPDGSIVELFAELDRMTNEETGYSDPRPWHEDTPQRPKVREPTQNRPPGGKLMGTSAARRIHVKRANHRNILTERGFDVGKMDGRVAIVTGAARGQARAHAVALSEAGATVIACDIARQIDGVPYAMATADDLEETAAIVAKHGGTCVVEQVDVRSRDDTEAMTARVVNEFGRIDILVNAAGIAHWKNFQDLTEADWRDVTDVNLFGSVNCIHSVLQSMVENHYGRIVCTGSTLGRAGGRNRAGHSASKWALPGLVKCVAIEYAADGITCNMVNPTIVRTPMMENVGAYKLFCPDIDNPTLEDALPRFQTLNQIPIPWVEPGVISRE